MGASSVSDRALLKEKGAFYTPRSMAAFLVDWAVRLPTDVVLDPSCGDGEFLTESIRRLRELGANAFQALSQTPGKRVVNHPATSSGVTSGPRRPSITMGPPHGGACSPDWAPASDAGFWERTDTGSGTRKGVWIQTPPTSETHAHRCRPAAGEEGGGER